MPAQPTGKPTRWAHARAGVLRRASPASTHSSTPRDSCDLAPRTHVRALPLQWAHAAQTSCAGPFPRPSHSSAPRDSCDLAPRAHVRALPRGGRVPAQASCAAPPLLFGALCRTARFSLRRASRASHSSAPRKPRFPAYASHGTRRLRASVTVVKKIVCFAKNSFECRVFFRYNDLARGVRADTTSIGGGWTCGGCVTHFPTCSTTTTAGC